jgi:mycothiol synthase
MNEAHFPVRNFAPGDFAGYIQLHVDAERADRAGHRTSLAALCEVLGRPNFLPGKDLFVVEGDGQIAGCAMLTPELGIGRVIIECLVHPEHRRRGLATRLCHAAERRAAALGARVVQGSFTEENTAAEGLASALGFCFVHCFLELEVGLSRVDLPAADPTGAYCRHLRLGEEALLADLQNRSFAGTWGYNPNTVEEIAYRLSLRGSSPEGVVVLQEGGAPVGYCWTTVDAEGDGAVGERRGRIHMIGVLPEHRGRDLGRQALTAGLAYLKGKGIEAVDITVDSENVEACTLYESVGFTTRTTTRWYEKVVG